MVSGNDYETFSKTITYTGQATLTINFDMATRLIFSFDTTKISSKSFLDGMSTYKRAFFKYVNDYALTASFVERTTATNEYLNIPEGYSVYITQVFIMSNGNTDDVVMELRKNSLEDGAGTSVRLNIPQFIRASVLSVPPEINLIPALKVSYNSSNARSLVMAIKGSGTADQATVGFRGYIQREVI